MKILFLGYAVDELIAKSLSGASIAGNKMQINFLKELAIKKDVQLECITIYPVAPFPKDKNIFIHKEQISITERVSSFRISFLNLPIIKQLWQSYSV